MQAIVSYFLRLLFFALCLGGSYDVITSMTAKPSKCFIGYSSIECLGHNIVGQTVRPQEDKIQAIREATRPQTKRQMKSFLGLAGFYRRFIPSFSSIASPLTDLTKKDRPNSIKDWPLYYIVILRWPVGLRMIHQNTTVIRRVTTVRTERGVRLTVCQGDVS